jgi:UDP-glucose 4-epimerase
LEILGNGKQTKSYLEVHECVVAMLFAVGHSRDTVNTFNIGSEDWIDVKSIAEIVVEEMNLPDVKFRFTGGERGWIGDVPKMQLAVDRIKALRWKPQVGSRESVRIAVRAMLEERQNPQ